MNAERLMRCLKAASVISKSANKYEVADLCGVAVQPEQEMFAATDRYRLVLVGGEGNVTEDRFFTSSDWLLETETHTIPGPLVEQIIKTLAALPADARGGTNTRLSIIKTGDATHTLDIFAGDFIHPILSAPLPPMGAFPSVGRFLPEHPVREEETAPALGRYDATYLAGFSAINALLCEKKYPTALTIYNRGEKHGTLIAPCNRYGRGDHIPWTGVIMPIRPFKWNESHNA